MPELRVVAVSNDGTRLVLKAADSTEYTLPIDERLRAAVRGDRPRLGQIEIEVESHLRPRDIQARIRAGASAEEVASLAGIPVDRVRRFEGLSSPSVPSWPSAQGRPCPPSRRERGTPAR